MVESMKYGQNTNFEAMLINFVILKFMQFWSAKGDVAFKIGMKFCYNQRNPYYCSE